MALAAMAMGLVSCETEVPIPDKKYKTIEIDELMTKTVTGDAFFDYAGTQLSIGLYQLGGVDIQVIDTKFSESQSSPVSFLLDQTGAYGQDYIMLLSGYKPKNVTTEGIDYRVSDVSCVIHTQMPLCYMKYTVTSSNATSQVYVYPHTVFTALQDGRRMDYEGVSDLYIRFNASLDNQGKYQGSALLHNVQFKIGERTSPKMTIRIPYNDLVTITPTKTGYSVEGNGITGLYQQGSTEVPFEQSTIDNLKINVDIVNATYSIFFNCMGGEFESNGALNLGQYIAVM